MTRFDYFIQVVINDKVFNGIFRNAETNCRQCRYIASKAIKACTQKLIKS